MTSPSLSSFACLVVREFFGLSYRRTEALLADSPAWLADIGLAKAPDHNTLWRAFEALLTTHGCRRMMDLLATLFAKAKLLTLRKKPLAMDSTCFEQQHRSAHYDRRCRRMARAAQRDGEKHPGKWGQSVNAACSRRLRVMPKLAVAVDSGCHLILSAKVRIGNGSDAPDFDDLLYQAWRRAKVAVVVADAGYDSEKNHRIARQEMRVRSIHPGGHRPPDEQTAHRAMEKPHGQAVQAQSGSEGLRSACPERDGEQHDEAEHEFSAALAHARAAQAGDDAAGAGAQHRTVM